MRRALRLALRGQGRVEPNPMVGCVLVRAGRMVGEGFHRRFGGPHAEVEALRRAGDAARGATAFVTLEPCCHYGQTPPCTEALIKAGVSRVVAAMRDPFPKVNGGGIRRLRRAGIRVEVGLCESEAGELLAPFITRVKLGRPYVILKWAQSLDGKIATRTGDSRWISDAPSRRLVHRLRARVDGILVGAGTVLADDPELTARATPIKRRATRLVLDGRLRIPIESRLVSTAGECPTIVLCDEANLAEHSRKAARLRRAGVEVKGFRASREQVPLRRVLEWLGGRGFSNLLVEGGGEVLASFVDQGMADEALIFVSPRLIGGALAVSALRGLGAATVQRALVFDRCVIQASGKDRLYRVRFRGSGSRLD